MKTLKISFGFICLLLFTSCKSHTIGYTYKAFAAEGCSMRYSISKQDTTYSIIATVSSDRMNFLENSTMKIRTFKDNYFELQGSAIGNSSESFGIVCGYMVIPITQINSTAQFKITAQQLELMKEGIKKIRLSMTPMNHERTFNKDKIGNKLYRLYLQEKDKDDNF